MTPSPPTRRGIWIALLISMLSLIGAGLIMALPERSKAVDLVYKGF